MPLTIIARPLPEVMIIVPRSTYAQAVKEIVECGCLHPSGEGSEYVRILARRLKGEVDLLLSRVKETITRLGGEVSHVETTVLRISREVDKAVSQVVLNISSFIDNIEKLVSRLVELTAPGTEFSKIISILQVYSFLEANLENLRRGKTIKAVITRVEYEEFSKFVDELLKTSGNKVLVAGLEGIEKNYVLVAVIYPAHLQNVVDKVLKARRIQVLEVPEGLPPNPAQAVKAITEELENLPREAKRHLPKLIEAKRALESLSSLLRILESTTLTTTMAVIRGYIDATRISEIGIRLKKATGGSFVILSLRSLVAGEEGFKTPTEFRYPALLKPIADLITTYGHPGPLEIVPLALTTITLPIIFGLMFPDMGHGLVLVLAGIYLYYRSSSMRSLGQLAVYLGIPAMVFGFMAGEFFGADPRLSGWITSFWHSLGIEPPYESPVHPLVSLILGGAVEVEHVGTLVMRTIFLALTLGSGLLALASWLGVIASSLRRDRVELVESLGRALSFTGVFAVFGCSALFGGGMSGYNMLSRVLPLATFLPIEVQATELDVVVARAADTLVVSGLALMFLAPVVLEKNEGITMRVLSGVIEVFDLLLLLIGNTASFVRIMGLMLAHSGLMFGFLVLATSTTNIAMWAIIYVMGNILVLGLEVLIASAHTLRLHFYEMYSKFYRGGGLAYMPATVPSGVRVEVT